MSSLSPSDNGKEQVREDSDHPESNLAGDEDNVDLRHQLEVEALRHTEARLYRFVDRPLPLDAVLSLGAQFLGEDAQRVAESLDSLVSRGLLRFADGMVDRPAPLDAEAKKGGDPMKAVYDEWLAIVKRHPDWTMSFKDENVTQSIDLNDPVGTMQGLGDKVQYDAEKVMPQDRAEFDRFLELDRRIEEFEASGGYNRQSTLRARALYRMAGGRVVTVGLFRDGVRHVRAEGAQLGRGDLVQALAEEIAERDHGCELSTMPPAEQVRIMQEAEQKSFDRYPMTSTADFGATPMASDEKAPAPDPEKAPEGFEGILGPDGKTTWRSKSDPNVKLVRPDANA